MADGVPPRYRRRADRSASRLKHDREVLYPWLTNPQKLALAKAIDTLEAIADGRLEEEETDQWP